MFVKPIQWAGTSLSDELTLNAAGPQPTPAPKWRIDTLLRANSSPDHRSTTEGSASAVRPVVIGVTYDPVSGLPQLPRQVRDEMVSENSGEASLTRSSSAAVMS